jgi:hypothetical protein
MVALSRPPRKRAVLPSFAALLPNIRYLPSLRACRAKLVNELFYRLPVSSLVLVPERYFPDTVLVSVTAFLTTAERNGAVIIRLLTYTGPAVDAHMRGLDVRGRST